MTVNAALDRGADSKKFRATNVAYPVGGQLVLDYSDWKRTNQRPTFGVDTNGDGLLDACQYARGDFTLDVQIDGADLSFLLLLWGTINPKIGDLTGDGLINGSDLGYLLIKWGPVSF